MNMLPHHMVLPWIVALTVVLMAALAENKPLFEVALDMDNDGQMDRATIVQDPGAAEADLYIYLAAGDEKLDLSRQPAFLKKDLTTERVWGLESKGKGSLVVTYGCGGCSNDYETTLTIVDRRGKFLVAGVTYDWDTREGMGSCDINFLTGRGVVSRGLNGKSKPVKGKFRPMGLADWSDEIVSKACGS